MPRLIKLNKFGSLSVVIPIGIVRSAKLQAGEEMDFELMNAKPLVLKLKRKEELEKDEWSQ